MSFYEELKRRNIAKVAVLYIIAAWLLLQVTDVLSSLLTVPEWAGSFVVMLLLLGFFPVMIFSWVYELTPEGLKKEKDIDHSQSITPETGRKINTLIDDCELSPRGIIRYTIPYFILSIEPGQATQWKMKRLSKTKNSFDNLRASTPTTTD